MTIRRRRPTWVAGIIAGIAAVVALLAVGTPASAADAVKVSLNGLDGGRITAGRGDASFTARFQNTTQDAISGVRVGILVQLPGVPADAVRVRRQGGGELPRSSVDGGVLFADDDPFELGRQNDQSRKYSISFGEAAPGGEAVVTVGALRNGDTIGSARGTLTVINRGDGPEQTTPPNTDPGYIPAFTEQPSYSVAPPATDAAGAAQAPSASVPKSLYLLGSMLIVMGALSLFLIFRPPGRAPARLAGPGPHQVAHPVPPPPSWHPRRASGAPGGGVQAWPTVPRSPEPGRRPGPDAGPHTGSMRPVREPGPGNDPLPPWLRP